MTGVRKLLFAAFASTLLLALVFLQKVDASPFEPSGVYKGDLVLRGNNVTIIEGRLDISGSMIVENNASLIFKNAIINFVQKQDW